MFLPHSTMAPTTLPPRPGASACTAPAACAGRRPPSWRTRAGRSVAAGDGSNPSWKRLPEIVLLVMISWI